MRRSSEANEKRLAAIERRRREYPQRVMMLWKQVVGERLEATRKLVGFRYYRGDPHVHSTFSDGTGTVEEMKAYSDQAGLDFIFITDHDTVRQKRYCQKLRNVWWGQEPGAKHHHLGILGLDRKYTPTDDLAHDYHRIEELGGVPFIPHPAGWFPTTRYTKEQMDALDTLGDEFAIEVINGANQVFDCFDVTDETALGLWDKHLGQGKRVVGLGASDAHLPDVMGDVWTGVLAARCDRKVILKALQKGQCFASDGPALALWLDSKGMGEEVERRKGLLTLRYECADCRGVDRVRLVSGGRAVKTIMGRGKSLMQGEIAVRFRGGKAYYRLECFAVDERRAYGNPIYVREG